MNVNSKSTMKRLEIQGYIPVIVNGDTLWSDPDRTVVADSPREVAQKLKDIADRNKGPGNEWALSA
jgi:hypothetical protein